MKVVINKETGGFGLSEEAIRRYLEIKGLKFWLVPDARHSFVSPHYYLVPPEQHIPQLTDGEWQKMSDEECDAYDKKWAEQTLHYDDIARNDPALVQVVEELGEKANAGHSALGIVEIPDGVEFQIEDYDGKEHVAEKHRKWE